MKPVYQTICNAQNGNCLSAMVASLIEKPIEEVPNFVEREDWFVAMQEFMQKEGYTYERYLINPNRNELSVATKESHEWFGETLPDYGHINGFYDATVLSSKFDGACHAVVCDKHFNIVHDPNPDYKGIKQYPKADEIGHNGIIGVALWIKTPSGGGNCRHVRLVALWAGAKGFDIAQTFRVCVTWQIWLWGGGGYGS